MKKILLAERDAFLIGVYAEQLRKSGYSVSIVSDGELAVNRVRKNTPDLLILDASLPSASPNHNDGFSVLRELREDRNLKDLKIVMLSSFEHEDKIREIASFDAPLKHLNKAENTSDDIAREIKRILS